MPEERAVYQPAVLFISPCGYHQIGRQIVPNRGVLLEVQVLYCSCQMLVETRQTQFLDKTPAPTERMTRGQLQLFSSQSNMLSRGSLLLGYMRASGAPERRQPKMIHQVNSWTETSCWLSPARGSVSSIHFNMQKRPMLVLTRSGGPVENTPTWSRLTC